MITLADEMQDPPAAPMKAAVTAVGFSMAIEGSSDHVVPVLMCTLDWLTKRQESAREHLVMTAPGGVAH